MKAGVALKAVSESKDHTLSREAKMISGMLGKKLGMTQIFSEEGARIPVTVIEAGPCVVQAVKVSEKGGYNAIQLGYDDVKEKSLKKPQREYLKAKSLKPKRFVREIRFKETPGLKIGDEVTNAILQIGDYLDIIGVSKGKGFQGGVKKYNWRGGNTSHGSMFHRAPGSIGASSFPSRVMKGHGMPSHMGNERVTVQNLQVIDVNVENHTVAVRGAVPGPNGAYLVLRLAKKKTIAPRKAVKETGEEAKKEKESKE